MTARFKKRIGVLDFYFEQIWASLNGAVQTTQKIINDGAWHNLVVALDDSAQTFHGYLDGSLAFDTTTTGGSGVQTGGCLVFGNSHVTASTTPGSSSCGDISAVNYFEGYISAPGVWKKGLSQDEAQLLYFRAPSDTDGSLILFWGDQTTTSNDGTGRKSSWLDLSGNNNHGLFGGSLQPSFLDAGASWMLPVPSDLEFHYKFDEDNVDSNTMTVNDLSDNNRAATANGNVAFGVYSSRRPLSVLDICWDGHLVASDFVGLSNWPETPFALSVFYRSQVDAREQAIIGNGWQSQAGFSVRSTPTSANSESGVVASLTLDGGAETRSFTADLKRGEFHHVLLNFDGTETTWFVDGQWITETMTGTMFDPSNPLFIGASTAGGLNGFCGQIHDARMYNKNLDLSEMHYIWAEMNHNLQFGDGSETDCEVTSWSEWSGCFETYDESSQEYFTVRTRTRSPLSSSSIGCPVLQEWKECMPGVQTFPSDGLQLNGREGGTVLVRLSSRPRHSGTVYVLLDSTDGHTAITLSACALEFNDTNWDIAQEVYVSPTATFYDEGNQEATVVFRAFGYLETWQVNPSLATAIDYSEIAEEIDSGKNFIIDEVIVKGLSVSVVNVPSAVCVSWGDPHIETFDGLHYDFMGMGHYYLVRDCSGQFAVQTRQEPCEAATCNKDIVIKFGETVLTFDVENRNSVDPVILLSDTMSDDVNIFREGTPQDPRYRVEMPNGLEVSFRVGSWSGNYFLNIDITAPGVYMNRLGGLCSSFSADVSDDFVGADCGVHGTPTSSGDRSRHAFGETWKVPESEDLFLDWAAEIPPVGTDACGFGDGPICANSAVIELYRCEEGEKYLPEEDDDPVNPDPQPDYCTGGNCYVPTCDGPVDVPVSEGGCKPYYGENDTRFEEECSVFKNSALTEACPDVDSAPYYEACLFDLGATDGDSELLVSALEEFVRECQRTPTLTPSPQPEESPSPDAPPDSQVSSSPVPGECKKIEGSQIGQEGLVVSIGDVDVTFSLWVLKEGETSEYVGFTISSSPSVSLQYKVKGGQEMYYDSSRNWINPRGLGGPTVKAISHIVFCVQTTPASPTPSSSITPTTSSSSSPSASPSSSPSATPSSSASPSSSTSPSPSSSISPSPSSSPSSSTSSSPSSTSSTSASSSPSLSPSSSPPGPSSSISISPIGSVSQTPSTTPSASPSGSATRTPTPSVSPSSSPSMSPSPSSSESATMSPSATSSATPSLTASPSSSPSPSSSSSPSPSSSSSPSTSLDPSPSASPTNSVSPSKVVPHPCKLSENDDVSFIGTGFATNGVELYCDYYLVAFDYDDENSGVNPAEFLLRVEMDVVTDYGGKCSTPEQLMNIVYERLEPPTSESQCGVVSPFINVVINVTMVGLQGGSEIEYLSNQCELYHCYPGEHCANGGICSPEGKCECQEGICGEYCQYNETDVCATHPAIGQYHVITLGDFDAPQGSDIEGLLAAGGNVTLGFYSIGERWPAPSIDERYTVNGVEMTTRNDLVAGERLVFTSGHVISGGNVVYGDPDSYHPMTASLTPPGRFLVGNPIDFMDLAIKLERMSDYFAGLLRTGTSLMSYSTLTLTGTLETVNVFRISLDDLLTASTIHLDLPEASERTLVVINVMYQSEYTGHGPDPIPDAAKLPAINVEYANKGFSGKFLENTFLPNIVWNMPFAEEIVVEGIGGRGSILAPHAHMIFLSGVNHGQLFLKSFEGPGQVNLPMLDVVCPPDFETLFSAEEEGAYGGLAAPECVHGYVTEGNTCECWDPSYTRGEACDELCTSYCNNRGMCSQDDPDVCDCWDSDVWYGDRCELSRCGAHGVATGRVTEDGEVKLICECVPGFEGEECQSPVVCVHGFPDEQNNCLCFHGWSGDDCTVPFPQPVPCVHGDIAEEDGEYTCECHSNWGGDSCQEYVGYSPESCYFGTFNETAGYCHCDPFWAGARCDVYTCLWGTEVEAPQGAQTNGVGVSHNNDGKVCQCIEGYTGSACDVSCRGACNHHGTVCDAAGHSGDTSPLPALTAHTLKTGMKCTCDDGYIGHQCETRVLQSNAADSEYSIIEAEIDLGVEDGTGTSSFWVSVGTTGNQWRALRISVTGGSTTRISGYCNVTDGITMSRGCLPVNVAVELSDVPLSDSVSVVVETTLPPSVLSMLDGENLYFAFVDPHQTAVPTRRRLLTEGCGIGVYDPVSGKVSATLCNTGDFTLAVMDPSKGNPGSVPDTPTADDSGSQSDENKSPEGGDDSLGLGAIVGIVIGGILVIGLIAVIIAITSGRKHQDGSGADYEGKETIEEKTNSVNLNADPTAV